MSYHSTNKVTTKWKPGAVSKTKQSFAKECNINNIVGKCIRTGSMPVVTGEGFYGDFSNVADYQTQCNRVNSVKSYFAGLPAEVRAMFKHDPANLIDFVRDDRNYEECVKLGLREKDAEKENAKIEASKAATLAAESKTKTPAVPA